MNTIIAVFDTETTGLPLHLKAPLVKQPHIIEIGVVLVDHKGKEIGSYCEFVNPEQLITAEITKITGIVNADVERAKTFEELLPDLRKIFAQANVVCAHNLPFDKAMMFNELRRQACNDFPWPKRELCTAATFTPEWGRMPRLIELYAAKMGKPLAQTHRALDDARALAEIVIKEKLYEIA